MDSKQTKVFISHSSSDKRFVNELASILRNNNIQVWYDEWEILVGDSIVEKVFSGLESSDTLLIVLSQNSIDSKWVREELNSAVMRRLSINNIRLMPVLIETCDIPSPLKHIKYADFRTDGKKALDEILDVLSPSEKLWQSLSDVLAEFYSITEIIIGSNPNDQVGDKLVFLYNLLEIALNLRTKIEFRVYNLETKKLDFYEKIIFLTENGIEARSTVWHALVYYRSCIAHAQRNFSNSLDLFSEMLDGTGYFGQSPRLGLKRPLVFPEDYNKIQNKTEAIKMAMLELRAVMNLLCIEPWKRIDPIMPRL
jgi:hypothetical protein